jgi:hypothetical protein
MCVTERDSALCSVSCQGGSVEAFPLPVRTGRLRRQLIVSFPTRGSMRARYLPVIFSALGIDLPPQLVLHDTTEFSYHREDPDAIGILQKLASPYASGGKPGHHITCGVLMHSSLVVTTDGLPLGLAAIKFWTREKFHGANALKRSINPTRVPIEQKESFRWRENEKQSTALLDEPGRIVHIGDSESDIYELFSIAHQAGTHFLLRTCVDRLAGDGGHTVADEMREAQVQGMHRARCAIRKTP